MNPTTVSSGSNSCISDSDRINESNDPPHTNTVRIDDSDIHKPLAVRRATRKRRIPRRFRKESDLLPSAQLAAMSMYSEVVTPEPSPIPTPQLSPPSSRSISPTLLNHTDLESIARETVPNQFGLYRRFTEWPSVDPEDDITINHLADAPTFVGPTEYGHRKAEDMFSTVESSSNPFAPYLNATVYQLMNWFYQTSVKSLINMDSLVHDVLRAPGFDAIHLENFSALREAKRLDDDPIHPELDGWQESIVKIRLPKTYAQFEQEDDAPEAEIPGVLHRDLLQSIVSAFKDNSMEAFNLKGFMQLWKPSGDEPVEEIFGEVYSSAVFREMEDEIRSRKPADEAIESIVVPLMVYSDSTHLATFGTAAIWPIYFFIGLTSKYIRAKPTSSSAHHLAYIPSVSSIFINTIWYLCFSSFRTQFKTCTKQCTIVQLARMS
jgi:Plavaka transposase